LDALIYIGRFFRYFLGRLVILAVAAGLIVLSFFVCMDYMNINVLVRDGFNKRAATIMMDEDASVLVKVFTKSFIDKDKLLTSQTYKNYVIRSFNHKVDVDFKIIFPWEKVVQVTMTERISYIDGELPKEQIPEDATNVDTTPPPWQDGKYVLTLVRDGDNWKIAGMELVEKLPKASVSAPAASPGLSASPSASASASGTASPSVSPSVSPSKSAKPSASKKK
jgi:hypothetical protein